MRLTFWYTMYIMKKGDIMTNTTNHEIMADILSMADKDIWNVIFAIESEFGIAEVPSPTGGANGFIAKLFELRKEARSI
mgnify:FL=1|jgi:hypothetical protein